MLWRMTKKHSENTEQSPKNDGSSWEISNNILVSYCEINKIITVKSHKVEIWQENPYAKSKSAWCEQTNEKWWSNKNDNDAIHQHQICS